MSEAYVNRNCGQRAAGHPEGREPCTVGRVRWENLFADLEHQLEEARRRDDDAELADRISGELLRVQLRHRLGASRGSPVDVHVLGAGTVRGVPSMVGVDWFVLAEPAGGEALVPIRSVLTVSGLTRRVSQSSERTAVARLGIGHCLRGLARDQAEVTVRLVDGASLSGIVDRVGADHFALVASDAAERRSPARGVSDVMFSGLAVVRSSR